MSDIDTEVVENGRHRYKLACCGSLTIALPANSGRDPDAVLTCGRCGSPRGTLQALRDRSIVPGLDFF